MTEPIAPLRTGKRIVPFDIGCKHTLDPGLGGCIKELLMNIFVRILTGIIALEHLYFLWLEMFAWETVGKKAFGRVLPATLFKPTRKLAANQGLYNGFLAAGLIWTFFIQDPVWKTYVSVFFLLCISVAGIFGALTTSRKIFFIQALPPLIALGLIFTGW